MDVVNIVQIVTQGGAVALLAIILFGGWSMIPAVKEFLLSLTAAIGEIKSRIAVIETKQDVTNAKIDGATGAILKTGDATVTTLGRLSDIAHEDAAHNDEALAALERRLVAAIRRELPTSDPPAPPSRPSYTSTPATGIPRTSRTSGEIR